MLIWPAFSLNVKIDVQHIENEFSVTRTRQAKNTPKSYELVLTAFDPVIEMCPPPPPPVQINLNTHCT